MTRTIANLILHTLHFGYVFYIYIKKNNDSDVESLLIWNRGAQILASKRVSENHRLMIV